MNSEIRKWWEGTENKWQDWKDFKGNLEDFKYIVLNRILWQRIIFRDESKVRAVSLYL